MIRVLMACLFCAGMLGAAEIKMDSLVVGTRSYRDVKVIGANATDLYFTHAEGIANVKLKHLDPALQKQFNYDAKASAEAERRQNEEDSRFQGAIVSKALAKADKTARSRKNETRSSNESLVDAISESSLIGKTIPPLKFESWTAEPPPLKDKAVMVYFWAPWSIPCRRANAGVMGLQKTMGERMAVIGVATKTDLEGDIASEMKTDIATALDAGGKFTAAVAVTSIPAVLVIDRAGKVRYQGHPAALTEANLEKLLALPQE